MTTTAPPRPVKAAQPVRLEPQVRLAQLVLPVAAARVALVRVERRAPVVVVAALVVWARWQAPA